MRILLLIVLMLGSFSAAGQCVPEGGWIDPGSGAVLDSDAVLKEVAGRQVIFLGEHHENTTHHLWQQQVVETVTRMRPGVVLGIEMLPRSAQAAIDRWLAGDFTDEEFLEASGWNEYWQHDHALYMPVLRAAKDRGTPVVALNVETDLLRQVSAHGWEQAEPALKEGLSAPATPTRTYLEQLALSFRRHRPAGDGRTVTDEERQMFRRFVQVQQLWDRVMAHTIADVIRGGKPIVVLVGTGHIMNGQGLPFQLADLGHDNSAVLVPWDAHLDCALLSEDFADAVFGASETTAGPRSP